MVKLSKQSLLLNPPMSRTAAASALTRRRNNAILGVCAVAIFCVISIRNFSSNVFLLDSRTGGLPLFSSSLRLLDTSNTRIQLYCDTKNHKRHSSRKYTPPKVPSIFNCEGEAGLCRYFYPANFFDAECGMGRKFHSLVTITEEKLRQRKLWKTGPQIGFHTLVLRETGQVGGTADVTDDEYFDDDSRRQQQQQQQQYQQQQQDDGGNQQQHYEQQQQEQHPEPQQEDPHKVVAAQPNQRLDELHQHHYHDKDGHVVYYTPRQKKPKPRQQRIIFRKRVKEQEEPQNHQEEQHEQHQEQHQVQRRIRHSTGQRRLLEQDPMPMMTTTRKMTTMADQQMITKAEFRAKFHERLSFIHVHKAGGTSVYRAGQDLYRRGHAEWIAHHWFFPRNTLQLDPTAYEITMADLKFAVRYPASFESQDEDDKKKKHRRNTRKNTGNKAHMLYAVVRDPVERFISSIGQVMGSRGSENELAYAFRAACLKETPRETLACCLDYVEKATYWFELHFAPQALDIAFTTLWQDVPVAIFGMEHLNDILDHLGHKDLKARNGNDSQYRPDLVLTEMSVEDYDAKLLQQVCRLYEVDTIMFHSLGMKTRCDDVSL